jgi:hypothetical protein
MPRGPIEHALADKRRFGKHLVEDQRIAVRVLFERRRKPRRVRNDPHLRVARSLAYEPAERWRQIRVKARFGFVEHHQIGRTWC